jgi:AhpD family alkylhydroperoxidase
MVNDRKATVYKEIEEQFGLVPEWVKQLPDTALVGFWSLFRDFYFAETKIPNKYKELIGLAVSGATRCKYCALFHTEGARLNGATDDEITEASMMGSITMLGSTFLNAQQVDYEQFSEETRQVIRHVRAHLAEGPQQRPQIHA